MPHLEYTGPTGATERFSVVRRLTTIGASRDCDVVLSSVDIADSHATLTHEPGRYELESTTRANVFFVNGKKTRSHVLRHGDMLVIGGVEMRFSALDDTPAKTTESASDGDEVQLDAMRRLHDFSKLLALSEDPSALLDELIDQVVALTNAKKGFLVLASGEDDGYEVAVARNLEREPVDDPAQLLSDDIIREVITSKTPQIISDAMHDTRFQNSMSVINLSLSSVMCAPMLVGGELLGLIYVGNDDVVALFDAERLRTLEVFASQAALFLKAATDLQAERERGETLAERLEHVKFGSIIGACPQMIEIYKRVDKVASTDITVLVEGETGTGKELIAAEIHNRSPRAKGPFVTVNCGAIPETLIESELFGHVKGAFTGAVATQMGKFQAAHQGTLFLDEIGELPLAMQVKLLRAIQEKQVQRVGDTKVIPVDIRIVAATNRDLRAEVQNGAFREDLYFRLNVINIELPPLRERGDDVILIARYLLARYAEEYGMQVDATEAFDDSAVTALRSFAWPGNIRQLENHLKKALVLAEGPNISASDLDLDLPEGVDGSGGVLPLSEAREHWQRDYINRVLALNDGNRTKTARDLGVDPRTIFRHLEKEAKEREDGTT